MLVPHHRTELESTFWFPVLIRIKLINVLDVHWRSQKWRIFCDDAFLVNVQKCVHLQPQPHIFKSSLWDHYLDKKICEFSNLNLSPTWCIQPFYNTVHNWPLYPYPSSLLNRRMMWNHWSKCYQTPTTVSVYTYSRILCQTIIMFNISKFHNHSMMQFIIDLGDPLLTTGERCWITEADAIRHQQEVCQIAGWEGDEWDGTPTERDQTAPRTTQRDG